jgi:peptidoglycan/xylan/chitin deacetylase (PgdA/CDA1 family)
MLNHRINTAFFGLIMLLFISIHFFLNPLPMPLFALPVLVYFLILVWGSSQINSNYHLPTVCQGVSISGKEIALSFDDGPDLLITPGVLDILKKHNVKASFFCIGKKIEGNEKLLQRIVDEGHVLGNHSYSHSYLFDFFGSAKIKEELNKTNWLVEKITGKQMHYFRPPYGVTTPNIATAIKEANFSCIGWSIRSLDAVSKNETEIVNRVSSQLTPGSIILFHDTAPHILPVLEQTLLACKKNGFNIVSLNDLIKINPYV